MRRRALLTGALALAAALRLAWVIGSAGASFDRRHHCGEGTDRNVEAGHALLHGLPHERVFWSMPAQTAANALMCRRSRPAEVLAAPAAALLLNGLLVFGLGALLAGGTAGAAALALYAWISVPAHAFNDRWLFTTSLLLVAFLAVWRARAPSTRKTALLAAAVGFSLNVLSVLFLLPPLLALREWLAKGRPRPERLKNAALLLVVPWLFLLPWALASGTFRETGRSDANVIGGALGLTLTMGPGDERALAGIAPGESVLTWAAAEVARHPLRYLRAVARRFLFASSLQPLLLLAAFAALPLRRRRPGRTELGLLILYYLGLHCLMPVEERYFISLWPLAAAAAVALAGRGTEPPARPRWAGALAGSAFLPLAGLTVFAQGLVLAYPSRSADPGAWERESARDPDAWLLGEQGRRLLRAGRPAEAAAVLSRAGDQAQLRSWALLMRDGRLGGVSRDLEPEPLMREHVMRALAHLRTGRAQAAAEELARAETLQSRRSGSWEGLASRATRGSLGAVVADLLGYWPVPDRVVILSGLEKLSGGPLRTAGEEAREALRGASRAFSREEARRLVDYAQRLAGSDEGLGRLVAAEHVRLGSPDKAVEALGRLAARRPRDLGLRLDLARLAHASGRGDAALRALSEARRLCARAEDLRLLAEAYRDVGETRRAARLLTALAASGNEEDLAELARLHMTMREYDRSLRLLDELVFRSPENARWRNDRAVTLAFLGRKEEAIVELRLALAKDPGMRSAAQSLAALLSSTGQLVIDPDRTKPPR